MRVLVEGDVVAASRVVVVTGGHLRGRRVVVAALEDPDAQLDDLLVKRMRMPARLLSVFVAIHVLLAVRELGGPVRTVVVLIELLLAAYLIIEAIETIIVHYWLGERNQIVVPTVVRHLALVILYAVVGLSIFSAVTGVNMVPLLATSIPVFFQL